MAVPTRATMNTSATPMRLCVNESIGSICLHRSCARKAFPELRTSINSKDIPELETPRSEKGGDTMIHSQVTARVPMGNDTASDHGEVVSEDTINGLPSECQSSTGDNEGDQGLIPSQGSDSNENEQQGPTNDVTPVALRTRRRLRTASIRLMLVKENLNKIQNYYKSERRQRINPTIDYTEQGTTTHDR